MRCSHFQCLPQFSFTIFAFSHWILPASPRLCKSLNSSNEKFYQLQNLRQAWVKPVNTNAQSKHIIFNEAKYIIACQLISLKLFLKGTSLEPHLNSQNSWAKIVTALLNDMPFSFNKYLVIISYVAGPVLEVKDTVVNKTSQSPALIELTWYREKHISKEASNKIISARERRIKTLV